MTLLQIAAALTASPSPQWWEAVKGALLAAIAWYGQRIHKGLEAQAKRQVEIDHILVGVDGKNGLRSKVVTLLEEVDRIHERNARIDAITEYEKQQYQGEDRRAQSRRLRDVVHEAEDQQGRAS